jgi:ribonuclease E
MPKAMLINVTHAEESRVGIVADGVLVSFEIESFSREHLKGNIYKGIVHRIQPALEAAFVDIGADRDAFLPLDEICFRNMAAPVRNGNGGEGRRRPRIQDILKQGEEILVQIVKEQFGTKPPTLSTFYSLPGRYLVLLPGSDEAGISRRIEGSERQRIRALIEKLNPPDGFGIIVRTVAGFDQGARELQRDLHYLMRLWDSIQQSASTKRGPALVYREHDLVLRNIRDYFTPDIDEIHIDHEEVFQRARDFLRDVMPGKEDVLHLYQGDQPIFSHFNVEQQIESIYKRRVPLKSGGSIVIDGTEALTAIDVNSGRSVRGGSQEETAFRTNQEAAAEIARQLRLRDLGGLIVIDFIDMRNPQHIGEVEKALRAAMHEDKARHEVGRISHFGLLEVSRQRLRPAAAATSYVACAMCDGHGLVRTTESAALVALRKIHIRVAHGDVAFLKVSLPRDVALYLLNQKREDLAQLEHRYATRLQIVLREDLMPHQSEFEVRARVEGERREQPSLRLGGVAPGAPMAAAAAPENGTVPAEAVAAAEGDTVPVERTGKRRRRRRGRRRGLARQAAAAIGEGLAALGAHAAVAAQADASTHHEADVWRDADEERAGAPDAAVREPEERHAGVVGGQALSDERAVGSGRASAQGEALVALELPAETAPEAPRGRRASRRRSDAASGARGRARGKRTATAKRVPADAASVVPPARKPARKTGAVRATARNRGATRRRRPVRIKSASPPDEPDS